MPDRCHPMEGAVALVTGGSRGIGAAIAEGLTDAGARVVVTSRTEDGCDAVLAKIRASGGEAVAIDADLADPDAAARAVDLALSTWGSLDVLVNNAGILKPHFVEKITPAELDQLMAVNFRGSFAFCMAAYPHLRERGGSIVNVSALSATRGQSGMGAYAASKAAMLSMTRTMAREWGPFGIRVNAVVPGAVATDMIMPRTDDARSAFIEQMGARVALGRIGYPEDLVGPVLFLAGAASAYVTGQTLVVDGGAFE